MSEQREFTRVAGALEVEMTCGERVVHGHVRNLSMKGVLAECEGDLTAGADCLVAVTVDRDASLTIRASGQIVRASDGSVAIEFIELLGLESYWTLRNWVTYNAPDGADTDAEFAAHIGLRRLTIPPP
jgi:hypothetical protein